MPTLCDIDSVACACNESTVTSFMWIMLEKEAMRIFFIAHLGQIDGLCYGHSLLSVYNVAFALHCPDPATTPSPRELISAAPLPFHISIFSHCFSLSPSLHTNFFFFLSSSLQPPCPSISFCSLFSLHFLSHTHTNVFYHSALSLSLLVLHFIRSFALLIPPGFLVMLACFIALYNITKPPASLHFLICPRTLGSQVSSFATVLIFFPPSSIPSPLCLHPPSV